MNVTNIPVVIVPGQSDSDLALYPITIINDDRAEIITEEVQVFIRTEMPRIIIIQPRETFEIFDDDCKIYIHRLYIVCIVNPRHMRRRVTVLGLSVRPHTNLTM